MEKSAKLSAGSGALLLSSFLGFLHHFTSQCLRFLGRVAREPSASSVAVFFAGDICTSSIDSFIQCCIAVSSAVPVFSACPPGPSVDMTESAEKIYPLPWSGDHIPHRNSYALNDGHLRRARQANAALRFG